MQKNTILSLPACDGEIDLSVVIVSYNTRQVTLECVQSLIDHAGGNKLQIIVVDNCSSDGSSKALRDTFPDITVIDSPSNGGFAFANNIGFEQAIGRYIMLLNPDTRIFERTLDTILLYMEERKEVGILGPKVFLESGKQQPSMIRSLSLKQLFFIIFIPSPWMQKMNWLGDMRYATLSNDTINDVDAVMGCCMLTRREILETVGGLDQRFFMYGEETEWCHRIRQNNWIVRYYPSAKILHHSGVSTANLSEWSARQMANGHILFLRFTRGKFVARIGTLFMVIRDLVRFPWHGIRAVGNRFSWTKSARPWRGRIGYLFKALLFQPKGQAISRPSPDEVRQRHI